MKKSVVISLFLIPFLALLFVPSHAGAQAKQINLKFATFVTPMHWVSISFENYAKEVEKRTNGRIKVTMFHANTLAPGPQILDAVTKGIADMGYASISYTQGRFPLTEVVGLPLGYKSGLIGTRMMNEYLIKFKPKEFDAVKVMWLQVHGPGVLHTTKKPVSKLEDLQNMKIRSTGTSSRVAAALGASPVGMPMSEAYDALSRGIVEGILAPFEALKSWKLGEVTSYTTEEWGAAYADTLYIVMNKEKWNSIPADLKPVMEKLNAEWLERDGKGWDDSDVEGRDFMTKRGNKIVTLSKQENERWAAKVEPLLAEYVKNTKAKGLPGDEVLKYCQDYLKAHQK
jgi:TRAP-type C4-dicarboxylate transport system substrate-binding protein